MGQIKEEDNKDIVSDLQSEYESDIQIEEDQKKHKCDYPDCNAVFLRPSRLKRHKRSHTGEVTIMSIKMIVLCDISIFNTNDSCVIETLQVQLSRMYKVVYEFVSFEKAYGNA